MKTQRTFRHSIPLVLLTFAAQLARADTDPSGKSTATSPNKSAPSANNSAINSAITSKNASTSTSPTAETARLEPLINNIQKAYRETLTLQATFIQQNKLGAGPLRTDTGTVAFKSGGRMHWAFKTPSIRDFISDGSTLWIYNAADKQVIVSTLVAGASQTALNFLTGLGELRRDFDAGLPSDATPAKAGLSAILLTPREPLAGIQKLVLFVSNKDYLVREAILLDPMGNSTHLVFSDLVTNQPIEDSKFVFRAPAGVDTIQAP